jgi:hypothetical protein
MGPGWMIDVVGIGEALRQRFVPANSFTNAQLRSFTGQAKLVRRSPTLRIPPGIYLLPPSRPFPFSALPRPFGFAAEAAPRHYRTSTTPRGSRCVQLWATTSYQPPCAVTRMTFEASHSHRRRPSSVHRGTPRSGYGSKSRPLHQPTIAPS